MGSVSIIMVMDQQGRGIMSEPGMIDDDGTYTTTTTHLSSIRRISSGRLRFCYWSIIQTEDDDHHHHHTTII